MAKLSEPAEQVHIDMLKQGPVAYDLMRPGNGTPWEDRGARGAFRAFLSTCLASITRPALLLDHISRLNTTKDATAFAWLCGIPWAVSVVLHNVLLLMLRYESRKDLIVSYDVYYLRTGLMTLAAVAAPFLLLKFGSNLYFTLISAELKSNVPRALVYNLCAYALGPSLLAVIPLIGPPLALALIFVVLVVAGRKRLYSTWRGAIIDALIAFAAAMAILVAVYFVGRFFGDQIFGEATAPKKAPPIRRTY